MASFTYDPNLKRPQNIQANPLDALRQVGAANQQLNNVLLNIQKQGQNRRQAQALVDAATTAYGRDVEKAKTLADTKAQAATVKNLRDIAMKEDEQSFLSKERAIQDSNLRASEKIKALAKLKSEQAQKAHDFKLAETKSDQAIKLQNIGTQGNLDAIKLTAQFRPDSQKKRTSIKDISKDIKSLGGIDRMVDSAEDKITSQMTLMNRSFGQDSRNRIKGAIKSSLLNDDYLAEQFMLEPEDFARLVIETLGKTKESWFPIEKEKGLIGSTLGLDEWTPDITKATIADLKRQLKEKEKQRR